MHRPDPLSQLKQMDYRVIKMVEGLGAKFARPSILAILHGGSDARAVGAVLRDFIDYGLVSEHELLERLSRVKKLCHLSQLIERIYARVEFPKPPIPASDMCRPIETAVRLTEIGRQFRNCVDNRAWKELKETDRVKILDEGIRKRIFSAQSTEDPAKPPAPQNHNG